MTPSTFETFLGSIRSWLRAATDQEVLALHTLVTAELARRGREYAAGEIVPPRPGSPTHQPEETDQA